MNLGTLKPAEGSVRDTKRIGRGNGSGQGRTAGKGHNGYHYVLYQQFGLAQIRFLYQYA